MPPSTEHPHAKPKRKSAVVKKKKQGGQKGHKRHSRDLIPAEKCDTLTLCHPDECRRCGGELTPETTNPIRDQVWDLPPIKPIVDEYQFFRGHCSCCGITTQAQ